jgi:hypothetical protein
MYAMKVFLWILVLFGFIMCVANVAEKPSRKINDDDMAAFRRFKQEVRNELGLDWDELSAAQQKEVLRYCELQSKILRGR